MFNATFNNISVVSFIHGGNWNTRRKPPTSLKSLTNFITYCCIQYISPGRGLNSHHLWRYALNAYVVVNPTIIWSRTRRPPLC